MIGNTCERCDRIHGSDQVAAVDRFNPNGPAGWQAQVPDAPLRPSRAEAFGDLCDWYSRESA